MWKNVIKAKYGIDDLGWWLKMSSFSHGMDFWKSILACLERFKSLVHFEVKDGSRVLLLSLLSSSSSSFWSLSSNLHRNMVSTHVCLHRVFACSFLKVLSYIIFFIFGIFLDNLFSQFLFLYCEN